MKQPRIYVVTGANAGLGLATVTELAKSPDIHIIAAIRNFDRAAALHKAVPENQLTLLKVDVSDLTSVRTFCAALIKTLADKPITGLCLNAGLQFTSGDLRSPDGFELTFATNHLGHFLMYETLEPYLAPAARIVTIGSGTQNPEASGASRFGFRDGVYTSAAALAKAAPDETQPQDQQGRDAYAASKFANVMWVKAMAQQNTPFTFLSIDPGAMPGTGLARDNTLFMRLIWNTVLRLAYPLINGSTPKKSGKLLARLLIDHPAPSGSNVHFTGGDGTAHPMTDDKTLQTELIATSRALTA